MKEQDSGWCAETQGKSPPEVHQDGLAEEGALGLGLSSWRGWAIRQEGQLAYLHGFPLDMCRAVGGEGCSLPKGGE